MNVWFDLDGTLCDTPSDIDHDDAASILARCQPRLRALARVLEVMRMGHGVGIITGRGAHIAAATREQLQAWLGHQSPAVAIVHRPRLVFDWSHYVADKETQLRRHGVDVYVGDRNEDRAAALRAGAAFLWAHDFERDGLMALRKVPA